MNQVGKSLLKGAEKALAFAKGHILVALLAVRL